MKAFWDERYAADAYAYGKAPNVFFKETIDEHSIAGKMLFAAEGEGRNALYAAQKGLEVCAFDISESAKDKALALFNAQKLSIDYRIGDFLTMDYHKFEFDAAALIFAHFPPDLVSIYHKRIASMIKPEGYLILEGFSKNNLPLSQKNPAVGGPKNIDMLFSTEQIQNDFDDFSPLLLEERLVELNEGEFHQGTASVVRFIGVKQTA